jgi:hypothetical protein
MKHEKRTVLFRLKNNERCETAYFASKRNFAKQQVCFAKHETCFVSCFAKYETKQVSLETLMYSIYSMCILTSGPPSVSGAVKRTVQS